jgi:hypothetical protein
MKTDGSARFMSKDISRIDCSTLANDHASPRLRGPARRVADFDEEEFLAVR